MIFEQMQVHFGFARARHAMEKMNMKSILRLDRSKHLFCSRVSGGGSTLAPRSLTTGPRFEARVEVRGSGGKTVSRTGPSGDK